MKPLQELGHTEGTPGDAGVDAEDKTAEACLRMRMCHWILQALTPCKMLLTEQASA